MSDITEKKKGYLDRHEFHAELAVCKKKNELSPRAMSMFQLMAREVSKDYFFQSNDDRKDAIQRATIDLWKYWRNFKEGNVVQLKLDRNFAIGDNFSIHIYGCKEIKLKADTSSTANTFGVGKDINVSIANLVRIIRGDHDDKMQIFVDSVKKKITLMDRKNNDDVSVKSYVIFDNAEGPESYIIQPDKKTGNKYMFKPPPNAFSYFTSVVRNGIHKSLNELNPKGFKHSDKTSINGINNGDGGNGFYSI